MQKHKNGVILSTKNCVLILQSLVKILFSPLVGAISKIAKYGTFCKLFLGVVTLQETVCNENTKERQIFNLP